MCVYGMVAIRKTFVLTWLRWSKCVDLQLNSLNKLIEKKVKCVFANIFTLIYTGEISMRVHCNTEQCYLYHYMVVFIKFSVSVLYRKYTKAYLRFFRYSVFTPQIVMTLTPHPPVHVCYLLTKLVSVMYWSITSVTCNKLFHNCLLWSDMDSFYGFFSFF